MNDQRTSEAGFALVAALFFLVIVAAVITPFAVGAKTELLLQANRRQQLQLDLLADVIAEQHARRLFADGGATSLHGSVDKHGGYRWCATRAFQFGYRVQAQSGLVDLNAAEPGLIAAGLRSLGLTPEAATNATRDITRFRSYAPHSQSDPGREAVLGGYKFAPFETVAELADFSALRGHPLEDFREVFTVYSKRGGIDLSLAPATLREELMRDASTAPQRSTENVGSPAYAIEIFAKHIHAPAVGFSGFVFVGTTADKRSVRPVETLPRAEIGLPDQRVAETCNHLIESELVQFLDEVGS